MTPGMQVSVVNSYAATSDWVPVSCVKIVLFPTLGKPAEENVSVLHCQSYRPVQHDKQSLQKQHAQQACDQS